MAASKCQARSCISTSKSCWASTYCLKSSAAGRQPVGTMLRQNRATYTQRGLAYNNKCVSPIGPAHSANQVDTADCLTSYLSVLPFLHEKQQSQQAGDQLSVCHKLHIERAAVH